MFGAKTIVLSWYWVLFPAAVVWTPLFVAAQSSSFLLLSIFRARRCYFSGWSSLVDGYWFQKHQPSRPTTVTKRERVVIRNPDVLLQIDKGEAHPKKSTSALTKEKIRNFLYTSTSRIFCCRPLCIAPVQLLCKVIGDWRLRAAGGFGICTTHTCSKRLLVGEKAKLLIFARKKESCFPKVEHTWNWNIRRAKAASRHWKRENWNIFQNIWKKSNTPQGSVFLEWTIERNSPSRICVVLLESIGHRAWWALTWRRPEFPGLNVVVYSNNN